MTTNIERTRLLDDARRIIDNAKSAGRHMTTDERGRVEAKLNAVDDLDRKTRSDEDETIARQIGQALKSADDFGAVYTGGSAASSGRRFSAKSTTTVLSSQMTSVDRKSIAPSGSVLAPGGLISATPVSMSRPASSLLALIEATRVEQPPLVSYLRQTERTVNAAAVAEGAVKPTSVFGLKRVDDHVRVIAHLSEGIAKYWLEDNAQLRVWLEAELLGGLDTAVEAQVVNGDGVGENLRGLLQTSGIQTSAWSVDVAESMRRGLTKLHLADAQGCVAAMHPVDYERLVLTRETTGGFVATDAAAETVTGGLVSAPYGATPLATWGVSLAVSRAVPQGTGLLWDPSAVKLFVDAGVVVEWDGGGTGFTKNELVARAEGRFALAVAFPLRVCSVDLTA